MRKRINQFNKKILPKLVGFGLNSVGLVRPQFAAEKALQIFCSPRKGDVQSFQKKFLKKFKQEIIYNGDIPIMTYTNNKPGKKVLLCHGWESNSFRWRKLYKELNKYDYNIIMMDAPAHGNSGSNIFQALLYAESINVVANHYQPNSVIGHSVGGYSSIYFASHFQPEYLEKLIIMASPDRLDDITQRYFKMIGLGKRVGNAYYKLVNQKFGKPIDFYNAADFASKINVDGLIIHDKMDDINLFHEGQSIQSSWNKSRIIATEGYGHSLQNPEVYALVLNHLA